MEGYDEELSSETELDEQEASLFGTEELEVSFPENGDAAPSDSEDGAVVKNPFSSIVEGVLEALDPEDEEKEVSVPDSSEAPETLEGGEAAEGPAEPEAALSEDAWQSYLLLQERQHLELMAHLETLRNLNLCILVALGVVAGCLLMRQLSSFFK